jgi:hypothetical protein
MDENKNQDHLEVQDIQEFVISSDRSRSERRRAERASVSAITTWSNQKKACGVLGLFVVLAVVCVLVGILGCSINPVVVCLVVLIQAAMAALLDQNPLWLHGCVAVADIIVGVCVGQTLFLIFAACAYVGAILVMEMLRRLGYRLPAR